MSILELLKRFAIVITIPTCVAAAPADLLTLDQAVAMAVEHNRGVQNSALEIQKAQNRLDATRTRQYPAMSLYMLGAQQLRSFDFTLEKGILGDYAGTGPLPNEDVHLSSPLAPTGFLMGRVSQPLTGLIRTRRSLGALKTGLEIAGEQTRAERQKIVRDVKRVYYSLQQVESSLRTVQHTAALYREIEKLTSNYVLQQVVLKRDLLDVGIHVAKTAQAESTLRDQEAAAKEQLNQLLGRDIFTDFEVQPVLEAVDYAAEVAAARRRALEQRSEIRQTQLRQKQAEQDLRAKKAEYIPDLAVEFNNVTLLNYGRFLPLQSSSVGVSLTWEPFDWGRRKHEIAEKRHTIDQARNQHQDAVSAVLIDINDKQRKLRQSETQLRVARLSQEAATESARVVKNKYSVQVVLLKDVLQAQVNLEQSNSEYQEALVSYWNARAEFERALGEDL